MLTRTKLVGATLLLLCLSAFAFCLLQGGENAADSPMSEHRLIAVKPVEPRTAIQLRVGDMLKIQPFTYPIVPEFLHSSVKLQVTGDRCLELIGKSNYTPEGERRPGQSVFLFAEGKGTSYIEATLVDSQKKEIKGYKTSYTVKVE